MYVKCGGLDSAREIFDTMGVRDVFSWTSMVNGYAENGELEAAALVCVLSACGQLGCLDFGQWICQNYVRMRYNDISVILANAPTIIAQAQFNS
ncbi:hypothetical protein SADUNF_Sadunf01G0173800 [Salix dunnii]|uniref:Pentatricopeptide repeat protein n=1 Tax=Salix dunnii TaxID=1413687 RepID=A0A835NCX2_9ROSI|nr:hypothetical protein SADUNF_Sadunf01G0173800 [Salix dunnii]